MILPKFETSHQWLRWSNVQEVCVLQNALSQPWMICSKELSSKIMKRSRSCWCWSWSPPTWGSQNQAARTMSIDQSRSYRCPEDIVNNLIRQGQWMKRKLSFGGHLGSSVVEHLPLVWVVILRSGDQVPHQAPCKEPASPSAYVSASFLVSLMNNK